MKQFFKILALAALALPFTGCDVEYSDINILPDPVFEQNGLYTVNTISIYDDYETVINVSRTAGLSKELELDIVVDETLLAEYNELYNTDYKLLEAQFYDIPKNAQLASTVKSVDISVRIHPKALIAAKGMAAANNMLLPIRISNASTPVEDGGSMMQALLRLNIVEPIVQDARTDAAAGVHSDHSAAAGNYAERHGQFQHAGGGENRLSGQCIESRCL